MRLHVHGELVIGAWARSPNIDGGYGEAIGAFLLPRFLTTGRPAERKFLRFATGDRTILFAGS